MNHLYESANRRLEYLVKDLSKHVPEIVEDNHQWEALIKVAKLHFTLPKKDTVHFQSQCWLLSEGQKVLTRNYDRLSVENLPLDFYITMIRVSDWDISKYLLKNMPTKYVEQYLIEELPNIGKLQHDDHFRIISKRKDEWGSYPEKWLKKAYGENKNNG